MDYPACVKAPCTNRVYRSGMCQKHYRTRTSDECQLPDCKQPSFCKKMCIKHYYQVLRYGRPKPVRKPRDLTERFWSYVVTGDPGECWLWTGTITSNGCGTFRADGKTVKVNRLAYTLFVGVIPEGVRVTHQCHLDAVPTCREGNACPHRRCVNPDHLALRTGASRPVPTTCVHGHPYTEETLILRKNGGRACRTCKQIRERKKV